MEDQSATFSGLRVNCINLGAEIQNMGPDIHFQLFECPLSSSACLYSTTSHGLRRKFLVLQRFWPLSCNFLSRGVMLLQKSGKILLFLLGIGLLTCSGWCKPYVELSSSYELDTINCVVAFIIHIFDELYISMKCFLYEILFKVSSSAPYLTLGRWWLAKLTCHTPIMLKPSSPAGRAGFAQF